MQHEKHNNTNHTNHKKHEIGLCSHVGSRLFFLRCEIQTKFLLSRGVCDMNEEAEHIQNEIVYEIKAADCSLFCDLNPLPGT